MSVRRSLIAFLLLLWPIIASAQGFGSLGTENEGFERPVRGHVLQFPEDHGSHPTFSIEWWYVTATLDGADGRSYGIQWTLFRSALAPEDGTGWGTPQIWMGHAAITTPEDHFVAERFARGGIGQAGVEADPFHAWIDEWSMEGPSLNDIRLTAQGSDFQYDLNLDATRPFILHGDGGYSVKTPDGQASYYYSQPFYEVEGTLSLPDGPVEVTGQAWLDREWSSDQLGEGYAGWDWFGLKLEDGARLMGARMRAKDGGTAFSAATWIDADGTTTAYPDGAFSATPMEFANIAGRDVPVVWQIELPERNLISTVKALNPNAWMGTAFSYWEGPVSVSGTHTGRGYLEMTGYD